MQSLLQPKYRLRRVSETCLRYHFWWPKVVGKRAVSGGRTKKLVAGFIVARGLDTSDIAWSSITQTSHEGQGCHLPVPMKSTLVSLSH